MKIMSKVLVLFSALILFGFSNVAIAADFSANTKQPVLVSALNKLEAMNKTQVINVIKGNNSTGKPIKLMFRNMAAMGYGTCEAVTAKSADGRLVIIISADYKTAPIEAVACLIAHESVHHENTKTYEEEVRAWTTEVQTWNSFTSVNPSLKQNSSKLVKRLNYLAKLYAKDGNKNTSIANLIANQPAYASLKRS